MYKLPPWLYRYALDLLQQNRSNVQGYWYNEYYLFDIHTGKCTRVRQPGLGNEAITHLSNTNGRMSGSGTKPFQITPDGTCIRLEALRIRNSPTAAPVLFSSLYSKPLTTHHISSNGCITLSTYDSQNKTVILQISPNNDADGDGLSDDWETSEIQYLIAGDPTQWGYLAAAGTLDATTTYWQDGYTALQSFVLGLSTDSRELSKTTDLDLDGVDNSDDAAPDDSTINWKRTAEPKFAVIELPVTDVESLRLDDFSENGTVLFTRIDATTNGYVHRVLVDRRIAAHVVPIVAQHGGFGSIGPTLIGERMLGFRNPEQTTVECTWNPLDDSYVAFPLLMYHEDILDVRGNFRVDRTFPGLKTPQGLLTGSTWCEARIEQNGNIVSSDGGYWRFNHNTSTYGPINTLAEHTINTLDEHTIARSATLTQTEPTPQGGGKVTRTWNLVPGLTGLHISDEAAPFVKSQLAFNSSRRPLGVTQQGWVATASEIWSNGTWQPLKNLLGGTTPQQATLLGILDTGLGVARIQNQSGAAKMVLLVPVELAPEVLAVNSDFDEGRIDPATGYAIPDCDDMPNVDLKTGSGNTKVELDAERNHLDGRFSQGDDVVDDLHKGWFGVNPKACSDEFWNGANITIRKIDKIDDDTGYKESGQVRFYAKWGGNYYGIAPYDFQTLQPVNLVSAGVNLRPNEGVYGPSSTIPDGAEFYMEGVRPGKITLEWRLLKGSIDVKHEQTFKVETRKSPGEWKADLAYKIRLDTNNDPSGQINVTVDPRGAPKDSWSTVDRMSEYYDYYRENYLLDDDFQWCGMARLAGSQVLAGVNDASNAVSGPSNPLYVVIGELIDSLRNGGFDIFDSIAWQHHAYRSSGLEALKWTKNNTNNTHLNALLSAWVDYDKGKKDSDVGLIAQAARAITRHEQNQVIVNTWTELRQIRLENGNAADVFTILSENVMKPNGDRFTVAVPGGDLGNTADRWKWIDDGPSGSTNGIIAAWKAAGKAGQRPLVANTIREDGKRFSLTYQVSGLPLFFVRDHLDIP